MKVLSFLLKLLIPLITLGISSSAVHANDSLFTKRQEIIHHVIAVDGQINEAIHKEFWDTIPKEPKNTREEIFQGLSSQTRLFQEYQRELWECALQSNITKKITQTESLQNLKIKVKENFNEFVKKLIPDHIEFANAQKQLLKNLDKADLLLQAAASNSVINMDNGEKVKINAELIKTVLAGMKNSFARLEILLDPEYYSSTIWGECEVYLKEAETLPSLEKEIIVLNVMKKVIGNQETSELHNPKDNNQQNISWMLKTNAYKNHKLSQLSARMGCNELNHIFKNQANIMTLFIRGKLTSTQHREKTKENQNNFLNYISKYKNSKEIDNLIIIHETLCDKISTYILAFSKVAALEKHPNK